jgi:hypothetical protein
LGLYDDEQWRLLNYRTGKNFDLSGLYPIVSGKGYWFIIRNNSTKKLYTRAGSALHVTIEKPYSITLEKGWNQIGNPYNFDLSWNDIKNDSRNNMGLLLSWRKYTGSWNSDDTLSACEGAFVLAAEPGLLHFPVKKAAPGAKTAVRAATPEGHWEMPLSLESENASYHLGGLGMSPAASLSRDGLDDFAPPRLPGWLELHFLHPEYFYDRFTRDIVPAMPHYVWELQAVSEAAGIQTLHWDKNSWGDSGKNLVLFDTKLQKKTDMESIDAYTFESDGKRTFKVYYGTPDFIEEALLPDALILGEAYPTFSESTVLPLSLPPAAQLYQVDLSIYDAQGQKVRLLTQGGYKAGFYEFSWYGTSDQEQKLPQGVYHAVLSIGNNNKQQLIKRILLK